MQPHTTDAHNTWMSANDTDNGPKKNTDSSLTIMGQEKHFKHAKS